MVHGRVYSIRSHQTTDMYIGSTTQPLCKRMADHRRVYKSFLSKKGNYVTSYEIVKYADAYIELLFEGEFESLDNLRKKEGEYIREMECVNRCIAGRTRQEWQKEYYEINKPHILVQMKEYRVNHKPETLEYNSNYYEKNKEIILEKMKMKFTCECGSTICIRVKSKHERTKKHLAFLEKSSLKKYNLVH
jgi:hypothetical protein